MQMGIEKMIISQTYEDLIKNKEKMVHETLLQWKSDMAFETESLHAALPSFLDKAR